MATYRQIYMTFWSDPKVDEDFTPEDKYFYLYLMTNPHTNICGCYEIGYKQMAREVGYNEETIKRLIHRMTYVHQVIDYNEETKEMLIINWHKYNWSKSQDLQKGVQSAIRLIKCQKFRNYLAEIIDGVERVYRPSVDGRGTSVTVYKDNNYIYSYMDEEEIKEKEKEKEKKEENGQDAYKIIVDYLNDRLGTKYRHSSAMTRRHISARLSEGFTVEDFKTVIDKKCDEWQNTDMSKYLRPETLFGNKFESYLQCPSTTKKSNCSSHDIDMIEQMINKGYGE